MTTRRVKSGELESPAEIETTKWGPTSRTRRAGSHRARARGSRAARERKPLRGSGMI
jgi:hypothetical protein